MLHAIINVGKSSDIRLLNTQAYRAVSVEEVSAMLSKKNDIDIIIFEDITVPKLASIKELVKLHAENYVAYTKEEAGTNAEISEELSSLGISSCVGLSELQSYIERTLGVMVRAIPVEDKTAKIEDENAEKCADKEEVILDEDSNQSNKLESNADELSNFDLFNVDSKEAEHRDSDSDEIANELEQSIKTVQENIDIISGSNEDESEQENVSIVIKSKDMLDEDDKVSRLLEGIEESKETEVELNEVVRKKECEIVDLNNQLKFALRKLKDISFIRDNLRQERDTLKNKLENILLDDEVTEVIIGALDRDAYDKKISELESTISDLDLKVIDIEQLTFRIDTLTEQIKERDEIESSLKEEIASLKDNTQMKELESRIEAEVKSRLSISEVICTLSIKLDSVNNALMEKTKQFNSSIQLMDNMKESIAASDNKLIELKELRESESVKYKTESENYLSSIAELNETAQNLRGELNKAKFELDKKETQFNEVDSRRTILMSELDSKTASLNSANELIKKQEEQLNEYASKGYGELESNSAALELSQRDLLSTVGQYKKKVADLDQRLNSKCSEVEVLKKQNDDLRTQNRSIQLNTRLGNLTTFECNYTGKAIVLQVFGSGSVGVTTTAVSLCNKLRGRVLYFDMDIVSPKADGWFTKNPIIKSLTDIPQNAVMYRTGFGAFLYKGVDFVIDHESEVIQNVILTKDGFRLDYLSGLYAKTDLSMFMSADFSQLITYLGNSYDYIICDMGRIGGSEAQNSLIRTIDGISMKNVCVSLHDSVDIRSAAIRIGNEQVSREKTIWLLNMATSTKLDSIMQKSLAKSPYVLMPKNMTIFGTRTPFDRVNLLKDKLSELSDVIRN